MSEDVTLLENKVNTQEAVLMCLIQAVDRMLPGAAFETIIGLRQQADVAAGRGDGLAATLLQSAADSVGYICDLPGFGRNQG